MRLGREGMVVYPCSGKDDKYRSTDFDTKSGNSPTQKPNGVLLQLPLQPADSLYLGHAAIDIASGLKGTTETVKQRQQKSTAITFAKLYAPDKMEPETFESLTEDFYSQECPPPNFNFLVAGAGLLGVRQAAISLRLDCTNFIDYKTLIETLKIEAKRLGLDFRPQKVNDLHLTILRRGTNKMPQKCSLETGQTIVTKLGNELKGYQFATRCLKINRLKGKYRIIL